MTRAATSTHKPLRPLRPEGSPVTEGTGAGTGGGGRGPGSEPPKLTELPPRVTLWLRRLDSPGPVILTRSLSRACRQCRSRRCKHDLRRNNAGIFRAAPNPGPRVRRLVFRLATEPSPIPASGPARAQARARAECQCAVARAA